MRAAHMRDAHCSRCARLLAGRDLFRPAPTAIAISFTTITTHLAPTFDARGLSPRPALASWPPGSTLHERTSGRAAEAQPLHLSACPRPLSPPHLPRAGKGAAAAHRSPAAESRPQPEALSWQEHA